MYSLFFTGRPSYSPLKLQVAKVGAPFELDMNYTGKARPTKFDWFKNGQFFSGDGDRVTTSHTGIIFTRVRPEDTGQYLVRAITRNVGEAEASTTLKGTCRHLFHKTKGYALCQIFMCTVFVCSGFSQL